MAAKAERTLSGAARPDRPQIDADRGKNRDMEDRQDALGEFFRLFELQSDTAEAKIKDAGATTALIPDDRVGVGSDHGNAFGFALNGEGDFGNGRVRLFSQSACRG